MEDAKWIYDNCVPGTKVEFYTSSNPGPLGKPTAQKITEDEEVRNWDPTDPDPNNPWKKYVKKDKPSPTPEQTKTPTSSSTPTPTSSPNANTNISTDEEEGYIGGLGDI